MTPALLHYSVDSSGALDKVTRLQNALHPSQTDRVVERAANETYSILVKATPKKWFGQVRAAWGVNKPQEGVRVVRNDSIIMLWLEEGTKAHGPREIFGPLQQGQKRKKNALFIPLSRRAVGATDGVFGVGTARVKVSSRGIRQFESETSTEKRAALILKADNKRGYTKLIYGQDYVLAKRVRGIAPRHIVANERPKAMARLLTYAKDHIREAING